MTVRFKTFIIFWDIWYFKILRYGDKGDKGCHSTVDNLPKLSVSLGPILGTETKQNSRLSIKDNSEWHDTMMNNHKSQWQTFTIIDTDNFKDSR